GTYDTGTVRLVCRLPREAPLSVDRNRCTAHRRSRAKQASGGGQPKTDLNLRSRPASGGFVAAHAPRDRGTAAARQQGVPAAVAVAPDGDIGLAVAVEVARHRR